MKLCTECSEYPIHNSFFKLCITCNKKRLNENKSKTDEYGTSKKISYKRKGISNKKSKENRSIKTGFREKIKNERPNVCQGCGSTSKGLTISHTIPISLKKDLEFDPENIHLECMECHTRWEHDKEPELLLNYRKKLEYIKKIYPELYYRKYE